MLCSLKTIFDTLARLKVDQYFHIEKRSIAEVREDFWQQGAESFAVLLTVQYKSHPGQ